MLRRRSIRLRILVLVLVPVLALTGMYAVVLSLTLGNLVNLRKGANIRSAIAQPVSNLQYRVSQEEELAALYSARPSASTLNQLSIQEHLTDAAISTYKTAAAAAFGNGVSGLALHEIKALSNNLRNLRAQRTIIRDQGMSPTQVLSVYQPLIDQGDAILTQTILPLVNGPLGLQATDLVNMAEATANIAEENDLLMADLAARFFGRGDQQLFSVLATSHADLWNQNYHALDQVYRNYLNTDIPTGSMQLLSSLESRVEMYRLPVSGIVPHRAAIVPVGLWKTTERNVVNGMRHALNESASKLKSAALGQADSILRRLILTASLGLIAIIVAVGVAAIVRRGLVRQLDGLRHSAVDLSDRRLPDAISRLRAGQDVDIESEVPPQETATNEIGQVQRAFLAVHRAAIEAAVDEAKIRRGVNDVFRNLARRNQSLLTRQLQLLDAMERRVHDPDELADLFRIDHLTTRMRRHAEGLLIVAGGSSGRTWREPVPFVDVMRAAIAEVEDYTRIRVMSRTSAEVAGHAVADVIHLLAELVENATVFSPANTPVRIDGDLVANGLAVEIEDRGLGMTDAQIAEINKDLADPPQFDLSGSDQLGLFIVGQLARRHDIKITLRPSAFGGTTAVVLIPHSLVIAHHDDDLPSPIAGMRELGGRPIPQLLAAGQAETVGSHRRPPAEPYPAGALATDPGPISVPPTSVPPISVPPISVPPVSVPPVSVPIGAPVPAQASVTGTWPAPASAGTAITWPGAGTRSDEWPAMPDYPDPGRSQPGGSDGPGPDAPDARDVQTAGFRPAGPRPGEPDRGGEPEQGGEPEMAIDAGDLPVRVRQASLAPQLRDRDTAERPAQQEEAPMISPEAARSTMSALQRGWQRGRSGTGPAADTDDDASGQTGGDGQ